jgi:hypothetical protein
MSETSALRADLFVSGAIATAIALGCVLAVSVVVPFPWGLGQTLLAAGIASFSGSAVSYALGFKAGQRGNAA